MDGVRLDILPQPNDTTCGPTALHAVYGYWGDRLPLQQVIQECSELEGGGTLASLLGRHAVERGYQVTLYTFNVRVFDPTWFGPDGASIVNLVDKLHAQIEAKRRSKLRRACLAYSEFLRAGGEIRMEDLTRGLIRNYLNRSIPVLAGLSSTFLYRSAREVGPRWDADDIRGEPAGHFVVLCGYDRATKMVRVADPYLPNPLAPKDNYYSIGVDRVLCAILLGALTYDANLIVLEPHNRKGTLRGDPDRRK
jgi:hypothetical protein